MELSLTVSVITVSLVYRALCVRVSLINLSVTVSFTVSVSVVTTDVMCISFTDHIATDGCARHRCQSGMSCTVRAGFTDELLSYGVI